VHYQTNILIKGIWGERVVEGVIEKKKAKWEGGGDRPGPAAREENGYE